MSRVLIGLALVLAATPAFAQNETKTSPSACKTMPIPRIEGCTALINSGQKPRQSRPTSNPPIGEQQEVRPPRRGHRRCHAGDCDHPRLRQRLRGPGAAVIVSRGLERPGHCRIHQGARTEIHARRFAPSIVCDRGKAYENKGMHDAAIADFSQGIAVKPDFASGYNSRAWSLHMKGEDAKGLADIEKAIALAPQRRRLQRDARRDIGEARTTRHGVRGLPRGAETRSDRQSIPPPL